MAGYVAVPHEVIQINAEIFNINSPAITTQKKTHLLPTLQLTKIPNRTTHPYILTVPGNTNAGIDKNCGPSAFSRDKIHGSLT